jgi:two-component system CheB/CheR fusion protein
VDEEALTQARQAIYSPKAVSDLAPELLTKYFEWVGTRYVFRSHLAYP